MKRTPDASDSPHHCGLLDIGKGEALQRYAPYSLLRARHQGARWASTHTAAEARFLLYDLSWRRHAGEEGREPGRSHGSDKGEMVVRHAGVLQVPDEDGLEPRVLR